MGRRKKAVKKVVKKKRYEVSKVFKCLFCNHEKSVTCQLDIKTKVGQLVCSVCDAQYKTSIHDLTEAIDIFTEWLDETTEAQAKAAKGYAINREKEQAHLQEKVDRLFETDGAGEEEEEDEAVDEEEED